MKKLLSLTLIIFFLFSDMPVALAAGRTYELPELNMTIKTPDGWYVFTQDVKENDPDLKTLGIKGKGLANYYKENGIYLDIERINPIAKIYMAMDDSTYSRDIYDFNLMSDEEVKTEVETTSKETEEQGEEGQPKYTEGFIYKHKQAKFYVRRLTGQFGDITGYGIEYITIINGQLISIEMLHFNEDEITESLEQTLKDIIDSIEFTKVTPKPVLEAPPAATYELTEAKMTIDSPEGWFVFTQDLKEDDPNLKLLGINGLGLADYFKENGIYLYMRKEDSKDLIIVGIDDYGNESYADFNEMNDDILLKSASEGMEEGTYSDFAVYVHKQTKFIIMYGEDRTEFMTYINGKMIYISLSSYDSEISGSLAQTLKRTVDSITFTRVSSAPVSHAGQAAAAFDLPELNMAIESPEGWYAFSRDVKEDDLNLRLLGMEGKGLAGQYKENGIFLNMISPDAYAQINVALSGESRGIYDFIDMTDEYLLFWAPIVQENVKKEGETFSDCSVYTQEQVKFIVYDFTQQANGATVYGKRYFTVVNGQWVEISLLYNNEGEIPGSFEEALKSTVDSIEFSKVSAGPASAAAVPDAAKCELPELNMTIGSPKGWYVFTQEVKEDDPNLKALGMDGSGLAEQYKENGTYLDMESAVSDAGIFVTMTDSGTTRNIYDFNRLPEEDMLAEAEAILQGENKTIEQAGFSDCSVYTQDQAKFAVCDFTWQANDEKVYGRKYITVKNGQAIDITLYSSKEEISGSLEQALKSTVDSITFTEVSKPADDAIAVYASLSGATAGAVIGAAIITIRKRKTGRTNEVSVYRPGSINV